ncbi:MAG: UDP-N-acetylmuramate dehydrogenase [Clostridia bacterium]|nr:UDP-N-acetylmuramate dehydrogenase [Clostridia bacterium]
MDIANQIKNLGIQQENILYNEPMKKHTTFKIGGPAQIFIKIDNIEDLKKVLLFANKNNQQVTIIGNGSNLLVLDKGIKGITLNIRIEKIDIEKKDEKVKIIVGAGEKIGKLAKICLQEQITGLEELSGIPGTIGGAIRMNAGAHGKEMKDIVKTVKCMDYQGNERTFTNEELEFNYRSSIFKKEKYIITQIELSLQKGQKEDIKEKMEEYALYRKEKQPIEYPSAGSTFKRGNDFITAKLIDEAGLKGYHIGDAEVSTKHGGFVINKGNATAKDVLELIEHVKNEVYNKFKKRIELEIEIIGESNS